MMGIWAVGCVRVAVAGFVALVSAEEAVAGVGFAVEESVDVVVDVGVEVVGFAEAGVGVVLEVGVVPVGLIVGGTAFMGRGCDIGVSYRICNILLALNLSLPRCPSILSLLPLSIGRTYRCHK